MCPLASEDNLNSNITGLNASGGTNQAIIDVEAGKTSAPFNLTRRDSSAQLPNDPILHTRRNFPKDILLNALRNGARASLLGFSIRSGLLFLLRLLRVFKRKLALSRAIRESFFAADSARMAAFFGIFAFVWKASNNTLLNLRKSTAPDDRINGFISGALAGALACLAEKRQWRIDMSQQLLVRGMQAVFNSLAINGHFHFRHGNSLIFALATAQVMYGYVMRPSTIPSSYYKFIVTTGPIPENILVLARQQLAGKEPLDAAKVMDTVVSNGGTAKAIAETCGINGFVDFLPCGFLHPPVDSCNAQSWKTFVKVMRSILPVYATLNFVPMVVLKTRELMRKPQALIFRGFKNTVRSSMFLGVYVATFMRVACLMRVPIFRRIFRHDSRYFYWLNGFLSSAAIFIEDEKRRSELAMYVLPKGLDALYQTLYSKSWIFGIPHFEVAMFGTGMGLIIMFFQSEPQALGGIIYRLFRRIDLTIEDADSVINPSVANVAAKKV
ncbi:hypothetical protein HK100_011248 [Physocladia obscura]|uniref:Transmembrane protein 135 N-terminal domain-containing protein n=1 Tax=Physocladia obscura TaxID=109957 RepID=A0AAD5T441_9FUNG|nr:hypothetical protein HK100_011248 [Physocladia obscura]